ncbi:SWI/SNF-related matrix-associated actin-dependent regulator of chromatin subfamily A-like protein 1 isoform X1 [Rhizophagus clarus]|uniref:SWI/SNF-related matrix-associated actin-dependent regulator of chromatin subfamily A-like protein 1 isoform X1 n=1 Tax=Rhizophagus clarus TaxID=94130 RepID=A0A8H3QYW4_9GLOM|nr:SWI/SNF-related matrix-associated actin-dependent regulator of chromatin subfamily A-like protein 1 isoform X1 [Rhizophagus clarus]
MAPKSRPDHPFCACGKLVRLCYFVKKNHPRHRDRYWGCPKRSCEHFEWVDPYPGRTTGSQNAQSNSNSHATSAGAGSIGLEELFNASPSDDELGKNYNYPIKVTFSVDSDGHFVVRGYHHILREYWRSRRGASYDMAKKGWIIPMTEYENSVKELKMYKKIPMEVIGISGYVEKAVKFRAAKPQVEECQIKEKIGSLWEALLSHQKEGVREAVARSGRVLLGDDMGLGKTIQALAIAEYYKDDGKVLVICPASVSGNWECEIKKWLGAKDEEIWILKNGKEANQDQARYTIGSYELAKKREDWIGRFQIIIADESHFLKDRLSDRTKKLAPLMKKAKRVILLSGTPAESRPAELFAQINIVAPTLFSNYDEYVKRFCGGERRMNKDGKRYIDTKGAINIEELHWLLNSTVLIRRKKEDVNLGLPSKTRQIIYIEIPATSKRELQEMRKKAKGEKPNFLKMYEESGRAKVPAIQDYLLSLKDDNKKYIVFAHHKDVMDQICYVLRREQIRFIRIDGQTDVRIRQDFVDKFQNEREVKFAILSLTAASTGLNFQAADGVIFAELSWNPSTIAQGENRAHRIGRIGDVEIKYILSKDTLDLVQWQMLKRKSKVLGIIFDNEDNVSLDEIREQDHWMIEALDKEVASQCGNELNTQDIRNFFTISTLNDNDDNPVKLQEIIAEKSDNNLDKDRLKACTIFDEMADNLNWDFDIGSSKKPASGDKMEMKATSPVEVPTIFDIMADDLDWDFDKDLDLNFDYDYARAKNLSFALADDGKAIIENNDNNSIKVDSITDTFIASNDSKAIVLIEPIKGYIENEDSQKKSVKDHPIITISDDDECTQNITNINLDSTVNEKPNNNKSSAAEFASFFNQRYNADPSSKETSASNVSNVLLFTNELANEAFDPRSTSSSQNKRYTDEKDQQNEHYNLLDSKNKRKADVYTNESNKGSKRIRLGINKEIKIPQIAANMTNTYVCSTGRKSALATRVIREVQKPTLEAQSMSLINRVVLPANRESLLPRTADQEDNEQQTQERHTKKYLIDVNRALTWSK